MARIEVTDPYTGTVLRVDSKSPQAKLWGKPAAKPKGDNPKSSTKKTEKSD